MARKTHGLVVEILNFTLQRFAQRTKSARSVESLKFNAVNLHVLKLLQRRNCYKVPVLNGLARLAIFIDQALGAPSEIIFHGVVGKARQGAHAQTQIVPTSDEGIGRVAGLLGLSASEFIMQKGAHLNAVHAITESFFAPAPATAPEVALEDHHEITQHWPS